MTNAIAEGKKDVDATKEATSSYVEQAKVVAASALATAQVRSMYLRLSIIEDLK